MTDETDGYSTAALESLISELPDRLRTLGVATSPVPLSGSREPDLLFDHAEAPLPEILELIGLSHPKVVFLTTRVFDPAELVEVRDRDLPGLEGIIRTASHHSGDIFGLQLSWVLDGVLCAWFTRTNWYEELIDETEIAVETARGLSEIDHDLRQQERRERFIRLKELIVADEEFRAATVNKRTVIAKMLMAAEGDGAADPWLERPLLREVRLEASVEVARQEELLGERIAELAASLIASDLWIDVRTLGRQKIAVARFILSVSNGWMLSEAFLERLRTAAVDESAKRRRS